MAKKWICTVCGYIAEGEEAPEKCPQCKAPRSKFKELVEDDALKFVTEHEIGVAKGTGDEMIKDLNNHFLGECTEVGMYLAMSRQADREGYPEATRRIQSNPTPPESWVALCNAILPFSSLISFDGV